MADGINAGLVKSSRISPFLPAQQQQLKAAASSLEPVNIYI